MRDIVLVIIVLVGAVVAFRKPVYGILIFVAFGIINPHSFTWGFAQSFPLALITALATVSGYFLSSEEKRFPRQREVWILISLWILFCISTADALYTDTSYTGWLSELAYKRFIYVTKIFFMIGLSLTLLYTKERIQLLLKVISLSIGFFAIKLGFWSIATGFSEIAWGPERTFLNANNAIGLAMAMNVPLLCYLIREETNPWIRRVMWIMLGFSYPAILGTFSRGAWVGTAAATVLILMKSKYKILFGIASLVFVLIFLPLVSSNILPERVQTRFDSLVNHEEDASAVSRWWNWELCWRVGLANPLTGEGFNYYRRSMYPKYFPEFVEKYGNKKAWACHSMWLTIWGEHGIPAFILWVILLISCFLSLRKIQRFGRRNKDYGWLESYAWMIQVCFIVYCIVGTFLDIAYFDVFYQLIGAIILLKEYMHSVERSGHVTRKKMRHSQEHKNPILVSTT